MQQPQVLSCDKHDLNDLAKLIAQQTEIIIPLIYFQSMFCRSLQMLVVSPFNHGVSLTASTPPLAAPLSPLPALQITLKIQKQNTKYKIPKYQNRQITYTRYNYANAKIVIPCKVTTAFMKLYSFTHFSAPILLCCCMIGTVWK